MSDNEKNFPDIEIAENSPNAPAAANAPADPAAPAANAPAAPKPRRKRESPGERLARVKAANAKPKAGKPGAAKAQPQPPKAAGEKGAKSEKDMHYSMLTLPSPAAIKDGLPGVSSKAREMYQAALEGKMPQPPDFSANTHANYRKPLAQLVELAKKKDIAGLRAWKGGKGTRMNSSSTIPLGRFHQCLLIALENDRRAAKKAAKAAAEKPAESPAESAAA